MRLAPPPRPADAAGRLPERVRPAASGGPWSACSPAACSGCSSRDVNAATARVLAAEGCDVVSPARAGLLRRAVAARGPGGGGRAVRPGRPSRRSSEAGVDAVVVNSAGCGSAMKEYARAAGRRPGVGRRAAALSAKVRDFAEFLAGLGPAAGRHPAAGPAVRLPRRLPPGATPSGSPPRRASCWRGIPGLELREIPRGRDVLRLGGRLQPAAAGGGERAGPAESRFGAATGAQLLISANPGCSLQIASALEAQGETIAIAHTAEILDASIRGAAVPL